MHMVFRNVYLLDGQVSFAVIKLTAILALITDSFSCAAASSALALARAIRFGSTSQNIS